MSEDSTQDKSEQASQQKIDRARKDGQLARSKELATAGLLLIGGVAFLWFAPLFSEFFSKLMSRQMQLNRAATRDPSLMASMFAEAVIDMLMVLVPFIFFLNLVLILLGLFPGGFIFVLKAVMPKFSKMNPLSGLKRMFSKDSLMELLKSILKISLIALTMASILNQYWSQLFAMAQMPLIRSIETGMKIISLAFIIMGSSLLLVAAIDVPYQRFAMLKKLRMSKQEVKEEHKNSEGRPEIKQKIKQIQRQMSQARMEKLIPDADVVIVNPSHYAVALKYDADRSAAPFVIAKGVDHMAQRIKEIAYRHELEVLEVPELTRAIYYSTQVDQEIPGALYTAVAYILTYIMQLKAYRRGRGKAPNALPDFAIPESLRR
ncbi:flagellar biosynthesis protein FlhB [Thalassomonas haliotis]|uniref:Flagellar biosynthetic protein FlhB n=1 Tax=Thalassomonas haliotis TaxID=485448 RepID=A0ABY7VGU0_9GAMM|nr:flagellar biosynthesis protein FlhB [Thalassomonas haliotis]WDE12143.1 flagellar biosynthesis protein FlhB [Thalassomonas haliotis]